MGQSRHFIKNYQLKQMWFKNNGEQSEDRNTKCVKWSVWWEIFFNSDFVVLVLFWYYLLKRNCNLSECRIQNESKIILISVSSSNDFEMVTSFLN